MAKQKTPANLKLSGTPQRMAAVVSLPIEAAARTRKFSVEVPGIAVRHAWVRSLRGAKTDLSMLKVKLPRETPPGSYQGTVQLAGQVFPISIDVQARRAVRLVPNHFNAAVRAGSPVTSHVLIANAGNTTVTIAAEYRFCIFEESGINRALFVALAGDEKSSAKRIDRLLDELADSHGGRVKLQVTAGSGDLFAGDARQLSLKLTFSDRLKAGRTYTGVWKIENAGYRIKIEAI